MPEYLNVELLKQHLHYDPVSGNFTWLKQRTGKPSKDGFAGTVTKRGYRVIKWQKQAYKAHRLAFLFQTGVMPKPAETVDHINHDRSDNRWINLRLIPLEDQTRNHSLRLDNQSGLPGVLWYSRSSVWVVTIGINGKNKHIGYFDHLFEAAAARRSAEKHLAYHPNHGAIL
jgi:hypothetical protein